MTPLPCENEPALSEPERTSARPEHLSSNQWSLRYVVSYILLTLGMACLTYGLIAWADTRFDMHGFWLYNADWRLHPVHVLIVGIGLVPPAIWEIFALETGRDARPASRAEPPKATMSSASSQAQPHPPNDTEVA